MTSPKGNHRRFSAEELTVLLAVELQAKRFATTHMQNPDDVIAYAKGACIGLFARFDPTKNVRLRSFVNRSMKGLLFNYLRDHRFIRMPRAYLGVHTRHGVLLRKNWPKAMIAHHLCLLPSEIEEILQAVYAHRRGVEDSEQAFAKQSYSESLISPLVVEQLQELIVHPRYRKLFADALNGTLTESEFATNFRNPLQAKQLWDALSQLDFAQAFRH